MNLSDNDPERSASACKRLAAEKHNEEYEKSKENRLFNKKKKSKGNAAKLAVILGALSNMIK